MFKVFVMGKVNNSEDSGEWIDLPLEDLAKTSNQLSRTYGYGKWTICKILSEYWFLRVENYQNGTGEENLSNLNAIVKDLEYMKELQSRN